MNDFLPNGQTVGAAREEAKDKIRELYTYYPPKTEQQRANHEAVNAATIEFHEKLIDILPPHVSQHDIISHLLGIVRNKANEALALNVNRVENRE